MTPGSCMRILRLGAAVADRYPDDLATGFEVGQLRSAFVIDWPVEEPSP